MGNSSFGYIRRTMPLILHGKDKTKVYDILKSTGYIRPTNVLLREVQLPVAKIEDREVHDAAPAEKFDANYLNGVYAPEVENDWAFEFQLTGGGS